MVLVMMFCRLIEEMVIVNPKDLDFVQMGAIGRILSVLATVATTIETNDLL